MSRQAASAAVRSIDHGGERPSRLAPLALAGYAFLILLLELALIRYVSAYVRVFGFYLNMVLIATFLGMGIGLLRSSFANRLSWIFLPALPVLLGTVHYFSNTVVTPRADRDEFIWGVFFEISSHVRQIGITPTVVLLFALCALVMVPFGALLGREFRRWPPLTAYSLDIAGSIAGIAVFGLLSAARMPPLVWFALAYAVWAVLSLDRKRYMLFIGAAAVPSLLLVSAAAKGSHEFWSPYYRINVLQGRNWHSVHVNGSMHQWVVDLGADHPIVERIRASYLRPLRLAQRLDNVLVVGSGTGNDVVNLLGLGAKHVDAVEIDPVILGIGRVLHPQKPYADPRVTAVVNDARAFLRQSTKKYDVIVFGTLDSQTLLSGMSSLRLDNYVYTVEAFEAARDRLAPGGLLVTYHMSAEPYISTRIEEMITEAFGRRPLVYKDDRFELFNYTFAIGGGADRLVVQGPQRAAAHSVPLAHDDWPYLYLRKRTIPMHYLLVLGGVLLTAMLFLAAGAPRTTWARPEGPMFFLGAGFLLLETKSVTEMSLLFGSTWHVNLLVFSSILLCILIANVFVGKRSPSIHAAFAGLFAALVIAFAVPVRALLFAGDIGQWVLGGLMVALPIYFAATVFASLLKGHRDPTRALGFNLLGAILGGVLEYLSMLVGTKGLYLVAAVIYMLAYWTYRRSVLVGRSESAPSSVPAEEAAA